MSKKKAKVLPRYVVRVIESQWDPRHEQTIKPFFEELRRGRELYQKSPFRRDRAQTQPGSDPLFDYCIFNGADDLSRLVEKQFTGIGPRRKLVYLASHGKRECIHTLTNDSITRTKLSNALENSKIHGIVFGSCLFGNRDNAEFFLNRCKIDWVAGYNRTVDWLASTVSDILFFRMLLDGWFRMTAKQERTFSIAIAPLAAKYLYDAFPVAAALGFNVFYRKKGPSGGVADTLSSWQEEQKSAAA